MKQVPLPLILPVQGSFETFWTGSNAAAVAQLQAELPPRVPCYLWGTGGSGKTHLLQALAQACAQRGLAVAWFEAGHEAGRTFAPGSSLILLDDVQRLNAAEQQAAFALLVEAQAHGVAWAAAGDAPPIDLPLREDLRTRLGWGQVHALVPLDEGQTRAALVREAQRRGIALSDEVLNYLLSRFARDLTSLMRLLDGLDEYSLARGRPVTVPLLRSMLAQSPQAQEPAATGRTP